MENKEKNKRVSESSWSELTSKWFSKTKNCEVWNFKNYFRVDFFFYSSKMILMNYFLPVSIPLETGTADWHRRLALHRHAASPLRSLLEGWAVRERISWRHRRCWWRGGAQMIDRRWDVALVIADRRIVVSRVHIVAGDRWGRCGGRCGSGRAVNWARAEGGWT